MLAPIVTGETKRRPSRAAAEIIVVAKVVVVAAFFMASCSGEGAGIKVAE